jgi:arginine decarboxylase-like protein
MDGWSIEDSLELYLCSHRQLQGVDPKDWARRVRQQRLNQDHLELFSANAKGEFEVLLSDYLQPPKRVSLQAILEQSKEPIAMLRFPELIERQMNRLNLAFAGAIQRHTVDTGESAGFVRYQGIYPLKVNQRKEVVETVTRYETLSRFPVAPQGPEPSPLASHPELFNLARQPGPGLAHTAPVWGLEAGSRPELVIALAYLRRQKEALGYHQKVWESEHVVVCNGGKDALYHRIALQAMDMGLNVVIIVDSPAELPSILNEAREIWPDGNYSALQLGMRVKTLTAGSGTWEDSGGKGSKFGLVAVEVIEFLENLKKHNLTRALKLLHFHIGSQIVEWENITDSMAELSRLYIELRAGDFPELSRIDIGGGLAINYEEHLVKDQSSALYDHNDYADMVVRTFMRSMQQNVKDPAARAALGPVTISSESGRFLTAPYSILAARVLDTRPYDYPAPPDWGTAGARGIAEVWQSVFPSQGYAFSDIDSIPEGASEASELLTGPDEMGNRRPALDSALWHMHRLLRQFQVFAPGAPGPDGASAYFKDENRGFFDLSYLEVLADAIGEAEKYVNRIGKYSLQRLADRVEYERLVSAFDRLVTTAFKHFCEQQQEVIGPNAFPYHPFKPSKRYIVNFSTFGQLIDVQLVDQYFPVLPLSQLDKKPDYLASLGDLTCDSDGEIKHFVSYVDRNWGCSPQELSQASSVAKCFAAKDSKVMAVPGERLDLPGVPVHECDPARDMYYIGWLFVGAYQDVLRTKHNLFGKPHSIIVSTRSKPGLATRPLDGKLTGFHTRRQVGEALASVVREMDYDEADLRHEIEMIFEDQHDLVDRMFNTLPYLNPTTPASPLTGSGRGTGGA